MNEITTIEKSLEELYKRRDMLIDESELCRKDSKEYSDYKKDLESLIKTINVSESNLIELKKLEQEKTRDFHERRANRRSHDEKMAEIKANRHKANLEFIGKGAAVGALVWATCKVTEFEEDNVVTSFAKNFVGYFTRF